MNFMLFGSDIVTIPVPAAFNPLPAADRQAPHCSPSGLSA
jgi:hypothetical protein